MPQIDVVSSPAATKRQGDATLSPIKSPARKQTGPPLDYSWLELKTTTDLLYKDTVSGNAKNPPLTVGTDVDAHLDNLVSEGLKTSKSHCNADSLRVCNNQLTSLSGLDRVAYHIMDDPTDLMWLDASFNSLSRIDDIISTFPNLKVLYLHGNQITSLNDILKLQSLQHLTKLTLHGNPVSEKANYKLWVLSHLPGVRDFDFSPVTKLDKEKVAKFYAAYAKKNSQ